MGFVGFSALLTLSLLINSEKPIYCAKVDGVISPVVAEYFVKVIDDAERNDAQLVIFTLDTPGGLDESMRTIVKRILNSKVPICVYVHPRSARAASAGVFITMAAHIAAMTPGTHIGAAHPVVPNAQQVDSIMMKKLENEAASYIRSIAQARGRNEEWAEKAVRQSVSITAEEALKLNVIDLLADNIDDLLDSLDGRTVPINKDTVRLSLENADIVEFKMSLRERILLVLSNPNVAYLLFLLGIYGLIFELSHPGSIVPGVIGVISIILAFYAFQVLPVNFAGILLMLVSIALFIAEVYITSHGLLAASGIVALFLGSLMLFGRNLPPFLRVSMTTIILSVTITSLLILFLIYKAITAIRRKPVSGKEGLVGEIGIAKTEITPKGGMVLVHGELWRAYSDVHIENGSEVEIIEVKGLRVKVRPHKTEE